VRVLIRRATLVVLLLALAGCGGPLPPERQLDLMVTADGYAPVQLEAQVGEQVFIRFQNRDTVAHSLTVELPSGQRTVAAEDGVDAVLSFPALEPGAFRFFCNVPGHSETGEIVISE
jgi:plastocyanin